MFPTLGSVAQEEPKKEEVKKEIPVLKPEPKQEEKAWWQKLNDKKKIEVDEQQEKVRHRKGKKKEKWVSVKGIFN